VKTNYVLVDYENVQVKSLELLNDDIFRLWVFLGPTNTKLLKPLVLAVQKLGERGGYVSMETGGPNAADFHIACYLGELAKSDPDGFFHIISRDTGFDPLIEHLKTRNIAVVRSESIEAMPCFRSRAKSNGTTKKTSNADLLEMSLTDLIKRKEARPRTSKTLLSTIRSIQSRCGTQLPDKAEEIYQTLIKKGYVKVEDNKVTYKLPSRA